MRLGARRRRLRDADRTNLGKLAARSAKPGKIGRSLGRELGDLEPCSGSPTCGLDSDSQVDRPLIRNLPRLIALASTPITPPRTPTQSG